MSRNMLVIMAFLAVSSVTALRTSQSGDTLSLVCGPLTSLGSDLHAEQGDTVWCNATLRSGDGRPLEASRFKHSFIYPFVNGTQWGAQAPLLKVVGSSASTLTASIAYPLPRLGSSALHITMLPSLGVGPVIGTPLTSLEAKIILDQTNSPTTVHVSRRANPSHDFLSSGNWTSPSQQTVMYWEPWFTPNNGFWNQAEAIPLVGQYSSLDISGDTPGAKANRDAIRMHCLWWAMAGITSIGVDWTNNVWTIKSFKDRHPYAQDLFNATRLTMNFFKELKAEGEFPVPQFVLILGLDNGPTHSRVPVLGQEIDYLYETLYSPQSLSHGVGMELDGKPLLIIFDGADSHAANFSNATGSSSINNFTIRWMASQLQRGAQGNKNGLYSWMDGSIQPIAARKPGSGNRTDGPNEALTITNAFFAPGGWFGAAAQATHNGATLLLEYDWALAKKPEILFLCQWNEYKGELERPPPFNSYEDIYNATLGNDMEPTAMTTCSHAPRPNDAYCGGWGFRFLNMLRFGGAARRGQDSMQLAIRNPTRALPLRIGFPFEIQTAVVGNCTDFAGVTYYVDGAKVWFMPSNASLLHPGAQLINNLTVDELWGLGLHTLKAVATKTDSTPCRSWAPPNDTEPSLHQGTASHEIEFLVVV